MAGQFNSRYRFKRLEKQQGAAMLAFILLLVTGASFMLLNQLNATAIKNARKQHDARVLAEAKQALIAYAVTYQETAGSPPNPGKHGYLPCPDMDESGSIDEGGAHGVCGSRYVSTLGRYPWRSLGMSPLKDSAGECLWYAVSGQYKSSGTSSPEMLNADTNGSFEIYDSDGTTIIKGNTPESRPVAVIFAPGDVIGAQDRTTLTSGTEVCGGNYDATDYLDAENLSNPGAGIRNYFLSSNTDQIDKFITVGSREGHEFNDRLVYITKEDIWEAINRRGDFPDENDTSDKNDFYDMTDQYTDPDIDNATKWIAGCIAKYGNTSDDNRSLPYPAPVDIDSDVSGGDFRDDASYMDLGDSYSPGNDYSLVEDVPLFGRVPDAINVTEGVTNKGIANLINDCDLTTSPPNGMNPVTIDEQDKYLAIWKNWKDHFFYAVSDVFQPRDDSVWQDCTTNICVCGDGERCVRLVSGGGSYQEDFAAIVIFAGSAQPNDSRQSQPLDPSDQKSILSNYIDNSNNVTAFTNYSNTTAMSDKLSFRNYDTNPSANYNDVIYCINDNDATAYFEIRRCALSN